ncbi:hypothetical protein WEI85_14605 [Actinomycetes bacterium KLBMP 9797]
MLVFVVIPAAIVLVISGLAFVGSSGRAAKRYRPGRPFEFAPVWFLSAPEQLAGSGARELTAASGTHELTAADTGKELTAATATKKGATGGASDRW